MNGFQSVLDVIVSKLEEADVEIVTGCKVEHVDCSAGDSIVVRSKDQTFQADHVISTMSLGVLKACHQALFKPPLPPHLITAVQNISFGTIDKIQLTFQEPFLEDHDQNLMILRPTIKSSEPINRTSWMSHIVSLDKTANHPNVFLGWISGDAARFMETLSDETISQDICQYLEYPLLLK